MAGSPIVDMTLLENSCVLGNTLKMMDSSNLKQLLYSSHQKPDKPVISQNGFDLTVMDVLSTEKP